VNAHSQPSKQATVLARLQNALPAIAVEKITTLLSAEEIELSEPDLLIWLSDTEILQQLTHRSEVDFYAEPSDCYFRGEPMEIGRIGESPNVLAAVREFGQELKETQATAKTKIRGLELSLNLVISNLVFTRHTWGPGECTYYSRGNSRYKKGRYNPCGIGYRPLMAVVDGLIDLGYIDHLVGSKKKWQSRMRALPKLAVRLEDEFGIMLEDVSNPIPGEIIRLKDNQNRLIDYPETDETVRMRDFLTNYNFLLAKSGITLPREEMRGFDFTSTNYHRVFNRGSFDLGGRFYGPWWVNARKEVRNRIQINGEQTVSLDFSAMNAHLIYSMEGVRYAEFHADNDPYHLDGFENDSRDFRKFCFLIAINSKSKTQAIKAVEGDAPKEGIVIGDLDVRQTLDALQAKHSRISNWFFSDSGPTLAYQESQVTELILERLIENGIPALNVHDEYIVAVHDVGVVRAEMERAFERLGLVSVPPIH
jgi:hypothetical protein